MKRNIQITLRTEEVPGGAINGATIQTDTPDKYIVVLDAAKSKQQQAATFLHEMMHIYRRDFDDPDRPVMEIEAECEADLLDALQLILEMDGVERAPIHSER